MFRLTILLLVSTSIKALTFRIPESGNIVGALQTAVVQKGEALYDIGRKFDFGVYEMIEANPQVDPWKPSEGEEVLIPSKFILPQNLKFGIVINLAEMRLYYFHKDGKFVTTHPVGIGRRGWATPLLKNSRVIEKTKDPVWRPPKSIRKAHIAKGRKPLPAVVPAGPDNPLGQYAMRLSLPNYLIHGTNRPGGIGVRSSSGCIRMYPEDIESLFYKVELNTPVIIIHEPYKVGKLNDETYIEAHEALSEPRFKAADSMANLADMFEDFYDDPFEINWDRAEQAVKKSKGFPIRLEEFN